MKIILTIVGVVAFYAAIISTINYLKIINGGRITSDGVLGPKGEQIVKKKKR